MIKTITPAAAVTAQARLWRGPELQWLVGNASVFSNNMKRAIKLSAADDVGGSTPFMEHLVQKQKGLGVLKFEPAGAPVRWLLPAGSQMPGPATKAAGSCALGLGALSGKFLGAVTCSSPEPHVAHAVLYLATLFPA